MMLSQTWRKNTDSQIMWRAKGQYSDYKQHLQISKAKFEADKSKKEQHIKKAQKNIDGI